MQFFTNIFIKPIEPAITYHDNLLLVGSCFTEHIGNYLRDVKFNVLQNPNGILFDPISVASSLISYIENKQYLPSELFYLNEAWHSWHHHSRFSGINKQAVLDGINQSQQTAHEFLKEANWLIVTLGSSFGYKLVENNQPVANCHKAPAQTFTKHLFTIEETIAALESAFVLLFQFNPHIKVMLTISPVRHLRDGVVDNNRSKARLIEAVHHLAGKFGQISYFPAYELVIDVLRDYRFFDIDLAHPNYAATQFVLEKFAESCCSEATRQLMEDIKKLVTASNHKAFNPASNQHRQFLDAQLKKAVQMKQQYPYLNIEKEINCFKKEV
ncbi:GSCFA domain-containing protein [Parasediminibacterium sp. JCM 36343]|uniref:GSCFA domain-containing protein n=1 Tax=Parasediminibacterium sp. JCM 36343 TaxID=3374279 RepID=UPI00397B9AD2